MIKFQKSKGTMHRRRIKTEEKTKVVDAVWGDRIYSIPCHFKSSQCKPQTAATDQLFFLHSFLYTHFFTNIFILFFIPIILYNIFFYWYIFILFLIIIISIYFIIYYFYLFILILTFLYCTFYTSFYTHFLNEIQQFFMIVVKKQFLHTKTAHYLIHAAYYCT